MARPPVLLSTALPPSEDPTVGVLLAGLCRATGAAGCTLTMQASAGQLASYSWGQPVGARLVLQLQPAETLRATCELHGAGKGPAATPAVLDAVRPLLEGALAALAERFTAALQVEVLSQILGVQADANFLLAPDGEILWANAQGEEVLARHTQRPEAHLDGDTEPAPLLDLVARQMRGLQQRGERARRRVLTAWGSERWSIEVVALTGLHRPGCCLAALSPVRLPTAADLRQHFARELISPREAEVLAEVLQGFRSTDIALRLGITCYTVKDHLKHAYAKLKISSRSQLLARLAILPTS